LLVKSGKSHHFALNQLELVLPVSDLWLVMIKIILVVIKVSQELADVTNDSLASIDIRRTMVADHIKNELNTSTMQRAN